MQDAVIMKDIKTKGSLSKVLRLISVLEKCNGKAAVGNSNALISSKAAKIFAYSGLFLLTVLLAVAAYCVEPYITYFIPLRDITQSVLLIVLILSFILAVKDIVNVLYSADDLSVLLPMPLSASQIVAAKLVVVSKFLIGLSLVGINSVCLGLGIRAEAGIAYIIGVLLSSILTPVTGVAVVTLLIVVVFRLLGFIRNRDITVLMGSIFTLALTVTYIFVNNQLRKGGVSQTAYAALTTLAAVSEVFPNISFMSSFMLDGNIAGLFISIGVTAAAVLLAVLAINRFYFSTALSMQNTAANKKAVTRDALGRQKKSDTLKALTAYEAKSTRRNPAYLLYGFVMSLIWPLLMVLPMLLSDNPFLGSAEIPFDTRTALLIALFAGLTASCFACGLNILPVTAFSREGSNFAALKALPVDFREYYKSKRNFSMLVCSLGSVLYVIILGVVCVALGVITLESSWVILYGAYISFFLNLILVNAMLIKNSRRLYLNWDSETAFSSKLSWINLVAAIAGVFTLVLLFMASAFSSWFNEPEMAVYSETITLITAVVAVSFAVIIFLLAFAVNRYAAKKIERNLMNYE